MLSNSRKVILPIALGVAAAGVLGVDVTHSRVKVGEAAGKIYLSDPQPMGEGELRTYAEVDAEGRPAAIGVLLTETALAGLPPLRNATSRCFDLNGNARVDGPGECEGDLEFTLPLPAEVAEREDMPFKWLGVNWNAEGHPPAAWSVPHFDFHFYIASPAEVAMIRVGPCKIFINCDDLKTATKPVPAKYVPADHINVDAAVSLMGNHLIDVRSPELATPPERGFTHTWIFGAFDGRITFYEPMVTLAFLLSRPDVCTPIRQPAAWQKAGYYPTEYCVRYDRERAVYTVSLERMVERSAD